MVTFISTDVEIILISIFFAWFLAQLPKTFESGWRGFFRGGGMPSSHSSTISALAMSLLLTQGLTPLTLAILVVAAIIIHDARGVRHMVDLHSSALNKKIKTSFHTFTGHTNVQVAVGAALGVLVALVAYLIM